MSPIDFGLLNTNFGQQIGAALDPAVAQERNNKLADLATGRQLQQLQIVNAIQDRQEKLAKTKQMQDALAGITDNRVKQFIQLGMTPDKAIESVKRSDAAANYQKSVMPTSEPRPLRDSVTGAISPEDAKFLLANPDKIPTEDFSGIRESLMQQGYITPQSVKPSVDVQEKALAQYMADDPSGSVGAVKQYDWGVARNDKKDAFIQAFEQRKEMARQAQEDRLNALRMSANLRPAPQDPLVPVKLPDGNVVYKPRSEAIGMPVGSASTSTPNKPLPTAALKMQQEELDAIGSASSINADLGVVKKQLETGKLNLGPAENASSWLKNKAGMSDETSRNYASFQATLEKLRNDSLRLNKGVQTDGDAQRAWNELFNNINDTGVVKQRLVEIQKINERAVNLRRMNIDSIRSNYGHEPLDTSLYQNVNPALGGSSVPTQPTNVSSHPQDVQNLLGVYGSKR